LVLVNKIDFVINHFNIGDNSF